MWKDSCVDMTKTERDLHFEINRIGLDGAPNTRDLGGMPADGGRRIRGKKLIRSGDLHEISEKDAGILTGGYALKRVIDFRTQEERVQRPDRQMCGVSYTHIPILDEARLGITREKESDRDMLTQMLSLMRQENGNCSGAAENYMKKLYSGFLQMEFARQQYRLFFEELLQGTDGSILWHCTAGKDRVGVGTMLLLEALGVDRRIIMEDYLKVNEFSKAVVEKQERLAYEKTGQNEAMEVVRCLFSVKPAYLEAVYAKMEQDYGSADAFLEHEMGLDAERKKLLRELYLVE